MLAQILTHTPKWVFVLLIALVWFGFKQSMPNRVTLRRAVLLPTALIALSLYGTSSAFAATPMAIGVWLFSVIASITLVLQSPQPVDIQYDASKQVFHLPGSWAPLALYMGIFLTKYVVGASIAMKPELAQELGFALAFSALYGIFAGALFSRAIRLIRLAYVPRNTPAWS